MVSQNQSSGSSGTARNEAHRMLATEMALAPVIRGIEDIDRILMWHNECHRLDVSDERKRMVKDRMNYLKNRGEGQ